MSMPPNPDGAQPLDLDAIRERADAATPGPWWPWHRGQYVGWEIAVGEPDEDGRPTARLPDDMRTDIGRAEDARFIAAARTDVPALVDEVERLRAVADAASAIVAFLRKRGWKPENEWFIPETAPFVAAVEAWQAGGGS